MKVEVSYVDDQGHYLEIGPQESARFDHLFVHASEVRSVEVWIPERDCLDVQMTATSSLSVRWSGLYHPEKIDLFLSFEKGERLTFKVKNLSAAPVFARITLEVSPRWS